MITIKLIKSLIGSKRKQVSVAKSLGLKKIGDIVSQPNNPATKGKIQKINHLIKLEKD